MQPGTAIEMVDGLDGRITDPSIFVVPPYMSLAAAIERRGLPPPQPLGLRTLTTVRISGPHPGGRSRPVRVLSEAGIVDFQASERHLLELVFDEGVHDMRVDLRPQWPLVIRY